jgi:hypothetical protein
VTNSFAQPLIYGFAGLVTGPWCLGEQGERKYRDVVGAGTIAW